VSASRALCPIQSAGLPARLALLLTPLALLGAAVGCRPAPSPAPAGPPPLLRALVIADFGDDTFQQWWVSRALAAEAARSPLDLALVIGDNLYDCGPSTRLFGAEDCAFDQDGNRVKAGYEPPDDPRFERAHEAALRRLRRPDGQPVPTYLALGNHDVNATGQCAIPGRTTEAVERNRACLEVAHHSDHWAMPARHYLLDRGPVRLIAFDSNLLERDYGGFSFDDEVAFVREATRGCDARRCFLVAHHPPAAARADWRKPAPADFLARVARIEAAAGPVAGWLSGHIHDLQHLRLPAGYDLFISGNGSRGRGEAHDRVWGVPGARALWSSTSWGFAVLEIYPESWSVRYQDTWGKPLHCCTASGAGHCEPVPCAAR